MAKRDQVPVGRLRRLGRLLALGPRAGAAAASEAIRRASGADPTDQIGEVLFETLGEMKAGSLKVGQLIAQVSDGLPEAARMRLGALYSRAPTLPFEDVAQVIEAELGAPIAELFASIEVEPAAAASLGQVHRARLADGTEVAVKVQYPGVAEALEHDLDLLRGAMKATGVQMVVDAGAYFQAVRSATLDELDYRREAACRDRLAEGVAPWDDLVVPRVHPSHSSERVLTVDWLQGPTVFERFESPGSAEEVEALADRLIRAVLGPFFLDARINADAHPGNFIVLEDGRLGLLDFGAVIDVPRPRVQGFARLVPVLADPTTGDLLSHFAAAGVACKRESPKMLAVFEEMAEVFGPPLRGRCDFAADPLLERLSAVKAKHPVQMIGMRVDPAIFPVFRALVGVYHALKHLGVDADISPQVFELARLALVAPSVANGSGTMGSEGA